MFAQARGYLVHRVGPEDAWRSAAGVMGGVFQVAEDEIGVGLDSRRPGVRGRHETDTMARHLNPS